MTEQGFAVTRKVDVSRLGDKTALRELTLSDSERQAVAEDFQLLGLPDLSASFELKPWRRDGVIAKGRLRARAVQACVVTLDPVEQGIDEEFEIFFLPEAAANRFAGEGAGGEIDVEFEGEDPPEAIIDGEIDLAAIALEQLALALDPYPRAKGAAAAATRLSPDEPEEQDERRPSPFAVLAKLKDKGDESGGGA
ncbi:DUF177 domain-containing protein [Stappia sp. F7233]|uniref:DUF177 domain-containing protein n=1 Tax=Stappia albiluteola TaxID=2758565 RepID=A0A839AB69_9HYPH|nr:DUF177 domain-containing protein [Stappia albiluteola]MBA5776288.1 DUF177 domain-containing protein [Stappia albiluteola]